MIYNKQISNALGYDVYSPTKESNFGEALAEFSLLLVGVLLAWIYLIAF